jgi:hypothetical protein
MNSEEVVMIAVEVRKAIDMVRTEYLEMPGLTLTEAQARRLWTLDKETCHRLLRQLVAEGFLKETRTGLFVRSGWVAPADEDRAA